jgi:hypothetical protein
MACPCKNVIWVECPGSFYKVVKRIAIKQSTSAHCDQAFISIGKEDKAIERALKNKKTIKTKKVKNTKKSGNKKQKKTRKASKFWPIIPISL